MCESESSASDSSFSTEADHCSIAARLNEPKTPLLFLALRRRNRRIGDVILGRAPPIPEHNST